MVVIYYLSRVVGNLAGYLYPAYLSYKAVKARDAGALDRWLIHWIVMSFFTILEIAGDTLLFWLPLYYELKLIIILWLVLPYTQGSLVLYNQFLQPALAKHEPEIDSAMGKAQEAARQMVIQWGQTAFNTIRNKIIQAVLSGQVALNLANAASEVPPKNPPGPRITEVQDSEDDSGSTDSSAPRSVVRPRAPRLEPNRASPRKRMIRPKRDISRQRVARSNSVSRANRNPDTSMDFFDDDE
ncbi:hypothetical protein SpCBS45565_g00549 [Spizellomyces sp. 'palustris']|nr:hypothetical protein SpCBS45565_g00549 [Spizellomyces sp. 'palustris']